MFLSNALVFLMLILSHLAAAETFDSHLTYAQPYPGDLPQKNYVYPYPGTWAASESELNENYTSAAHHGDAYYLGWTSTNAFIRFFTLGYGIVSMAGEPKHGVYNYRVPGAEQLFYWCDMGPPEDPSQVDGLADSPSRTDDGSLAQGGMKRFWQGVRSLKDPQANALGPRGKAAMLDTIAVDIVRVDLAAGANLWKNVAKLKGGAPRFEIAPPGDTEFYIFSARYPGKPLFFESKDGAPDDDEASESGAVLHTFVCVVPSEPVMKGVAPGSPNYGIHFDPAPKTECPELCGDLHCECDQLILDLRLSGNIGKSWDGPDFGLPNEILERQRKEDESHQSSLLTTETASATDDKKATILNHLMSAGRDLSSHFD